jgi:hypothetical protein
VIRTHRARRRWLTLGAVFVLLAAGSTGQTAAADTAPTCAPPADGEPMFVTEECVDPRFNDGYAFVGIDEVRQAPVPHRFVYGGFRGTDARFAFYFPSEAEYEGRFFQGPVHQLRLTGELASKEEIEFAFDSGAYLVETNNGGSESCLTSRDCISGKYDPAVRGYRVNAAAAKFSRVMAADIYGEYRPYGYLYGGSGGGYMTMSSAEHTSGVWDGFVPFVIGHPLAIPEHYTARVHALRVLRQRNKFPEIMDAIDPGGSGDPYATLNEEEAAALREATRLGFPPRAWWDHATMGGGALSIVAGYVPLLDPTYTADFWAEPGYLGTDPSPAGDSVRAARIQHPAKVVAATPGAPAPQYELLGPTYPGYIVAQYVVGMPPKAFVLSSLPEGDLEGADLVVTSGPGTGKSCPLFAVDRDRNIVACGGNTDPAVINSIEAGDDVRVDNSAYLALQTHHRHQVPPRNMGLYGWDQFRRGGDGTPVYPQRDQLVGPTSALHASGSISSGRFHGKMIVVESLMDADAFPWSADWYRTQVKRALGESLDDRFRLWFTDHAQHNSDGPSGAGQARTVGYRGVLDQALRDLSAWVEQGVPAPSSTSYRVDDAQVIVPPTAAQRGGIQPVVELTANGGERADVKAGEPVTFTARIEVPPGTGEIVDAEWDFEGTGDFGCAQLLPDASPTDPGATRCQLPDPASSTGADGDGGDSVTIEFSHTYSEPGTYFPVLRATSQREGDPDTPFARIQNLGRVRVVVS